MDWGLGAGILLKAVGMRHAFRVGIYSLRTGTRNGIEANRVCETGGVAKGHFGASPDTLIRVLRLSREFIWVGLGQGAAVLGSLVGLRLLTAVLAPNVYGELALGMTLAALVNQMALGPLCASASRFYAPARERGEVASFFSVLRKLFAQGTGVTLLLAVVVCLVMALARQTKLLSLALAAFSLATLSGYGSGLDSIQNAARQRSIVAWHQALGSWGRSLPAVGMIRWFGASSTVAMLGYVLATAIVLGSQLWFFRSIVKEANGASAGADGTKQHWRKQVFAYAWPFAAWGGFSWAQAASDRWALQMFVSTRDVGLYAVLFQLGYYPISLLSGLVVQLLSPVFYQRAGDATDESRLGRVYHVNRLLSMATLIATGIATAFALGFHETIFRLLVSSQYRGISWLLPGIVLAGGLFATGQFASISLFSGTATHRMIIPKIASAIIGILLNVLGAVWFGVLGVVCACVVTSGIYMWWIMHLVKVRHNAVLVAQ